MAEFSLIIPAGGSSQRFGNENKLMQRINGKTVIEHTVSKFDAFKEINEIIIPANSAIKDTLKTIFKTNKKITIIEGGATRQESVRKALLKVKNEYVLIHDAARPLIESKIISNVMDEVTEKKAVSVMNKTTDTIKEVDKNGKIIRTLNRDTLYNTQTPQAFETEKILYAHDVLKDKVFTDDASMLEELNTPVFIVAGSPINIKITTKSDLDFAKLYM